MQTYTLSPQGILKLRRRLLQRTAVIFSVILVVAGAGILSQFRGEWSEIVSLPFAALILIVVLRIGFSRSAKQAQETWESINVEMGDDYIARRQIRIPELRIRRAEITSIQETGDGLRITTADKFHSLIVPIALDEPDYQAIKTTLSAWMPIQPVNPAVSRARNLAAGLLILAGYGIILVSMSPWLILIVALAMLGYYGYVFWFLKHHQGVDPRFRRSFVSGIVFLIFITSFKLWVLLGGMSLFVDWLERSVH